MIMRLYFLARFDLVIEINQVSTFLKSGDIVYLDDIPKQEFLITSKDRYSDNYSFNLENCLNNELSFVCVRKINSGYLIELKPRYIYMPAQTHKKVIGYEDSLYLVEQYGTNLIQVFSPKECLSMIGDDLIGFEYEIKNIGKKILFLQFNFKQGKYCYIFNNQNLIFSGYVEEINVKENHLIVLCADQSCYGQKRVIDFNIKDDKQEEYFVYGDDREVFDEIDMPYLFLDAVKIKSSKLYKQYLSQDLREINEKDFLSFFEDFDDYRIIENDYLLEKNNEVIKVVHFEVFNNIITNIYD